MLDYQGIIGAIAGTVLGTISTLITTHILRSYGRVETSIFDVRFDEFEQNPLNSSNVIRLDFKVKFYNSSESTKVLDDLELVFLDGKGVELLRIAPDDRETLRSSRSFVHVDKLYFVNLSPKQLTLKKLQIEVSDRSLSELEEIKTIKLHYVNKRKKNHVIYRRI